MILIRSILVFLYFMQSYYLAEVLDRAFASWELTIVFMISLCMKNGHSGVDSTRSLASRDLQIGKLHSSAFRVALGELIHWTTACRSVYNSSGGVDLGHVH